MPPSISRNSLSALSRCRSSATSIPLRSFSTTSPVSAIGPENPKFIDVPTTPQPQAIPRSDIKGTLPPPRDIFGRGSGVKRLMKTIEEPSFKALESDIPNGSPSKSSSPEEAAEDRIALKRFFEAVTFEPGETINYAAALEKATAAINKRAQEIAGREDRAHELASLKRHAHQLKVWPEYFKAVTPEPTSQTEPANDYVAWKRRMAASRRENLRTGLVKLSYRKAARETGVAHGSRERTREREKLLYAPQREDERLTATTIIEAVSGLQKGAAVPDPGREVRVAAKAARVQAKEIAREQQRRDALHTLYMHARDFIVTEQQLDDEIEKIFTDTPHRPGDHRSNIWSVKDSPITVQDMLSQVNNTEKRALQFHSHGAFRTGERMKKIAEELTGGKMD